MVKIQKMLTDENIKKPAISCVRMFMPSEWAEMGVSRYKFYSDVYNHSCRDEANLLKIENTPIVPFHDKFIGNKPVLWSLFAGRHA